MNRIIGNLLAAMLMAALAKPCVVTVYSARFHGRRTATGERYDHRGLTAAVPRSRRDLLGRRAILFSYRARPAARGGTYVRELVRVPVRFTDTLGPGARADHFDLSGGAWAALTRGAAPSRTRAWWVLVP